MAYKTYNSQGLEALRSKDRRISFLSIFSTLFLNAKSRGDDDIDGAVIKAIEINDKLYKKYPFPEQQDTPYIKRAKSEDQILDEAKNGKANEKFALAEEND